MCFPNDSSDSSIPFCHTILDCVMQNIYTLAYGNSDIKGECVREREKERERERLLTTIDKLLTLQM